uniref:Uncharacterized protein n=1 Tax=Arundo donax TaxID=35708 RepID=A0A0A9CA90_ARUDO
MAVSFRTATAAAATSPRRRRRTAATAVAPLAEPPMAEGSRGARRGNTCGTTSAWRRTWPTAAR